MLMAISMVGFGFQVPSCTFQTLIAVTIPTVSSEPRWSGSSQISTFKWVSKEDCGAGLGAQLSLLGSSTGRFHASVQPFAGASLPSHLLTKNPIPTELAVVQWLIFSTGTIVRVHWVRAVSIGIPNPLLASSPMS